MLHNPVTINLERKSAPAVGITQAVYPVPAELKSALLVELLKRGEIRSVIVFTRTKHRANRLADYLARARRARGRIHGNRSQAQRTQALDGFKAGKFPVLVATDIAARGIDVEALSHVINFDVPALPGRLHPPRGPHGARRGDGRRLPVRLARGGERTCAPSSARSASACRA